MSKKIACIAAALMVLPMVAISAEDPADIAAVVGAVKAANPDFKALCQKGPDTIRKAVTDAVMAQMATGIDASALLTYRAAWLRDRGRNVTREAAMAKMTATETAQQVIDSAVQIWGGLGVVSGHPVEKLYREIRALRIYEGATEVQQLIIARQTLAAHEQASGA